MSELEKSNWQKTQWSLGSIKLYFAVLQREQQREHKLTHHSFTKSCTVIADDILLDGWRSRMKKKKTKPQPSEFAIGQEDNVLCIKCGGVADEKCILLRLLV